MLSLVWIPAPLCWSQAQRLPLSSCPDLHANAPHRPCASPPGVPQDCPLCSLRPAPQLGTHIVHVTEPCYVPFLVLGTQQGHTKQKTSSMEGGERTDKE